MSPGLGSVFQRRRKKNGSSRRWAIRSKQPFRTSVVTPTAPGPVPNNRIKMEIEEASVQEDTKQLSPTRHIGALFFAVRSVMQKFRNIISTTCSGFLNVFLFWRGYAERVESLHRKVEELQREIALLHSSLKLLREAKGACGTLAIPDGAAHHSVPTPPPAVSLPPPPPPPPPPPLPPTFAVPKVCVFAKRSAKPPTPKKKDGPVAVTLRDLQTVRLRKVGVSNKTQISPDKRRNPLVTLADLQKVRLRRSHSDVSIRFRSSLGRSPTKGSMNLRVQLRKINMSRSPGGTPLCNKENEEMDSSLELSMTKALGNKHLSAIPKGLSPLKSV